jgi:uncharacterized protein YqeY
MSLYDKILSDLKTSMLARDSSKSLVLRSLKAAILEKEISLRSGGERSELTDEVITQVLMKAAKQRKDSLQQYEQAGREDLAATERYELAIIDVYLPKMMSEEEIQAVVSETAKQVGVSSPAEMGKLMGALMGKVKGKADGALVNRVVKEYLSSQ